MVTFEVVGPGGAVVNFGYVDGLGGKEEEEGGASSSQTTKMEWVGASAPDGAWQLDDIRVLSAGGDEAFGDAISPTVGKSLSKDLSNYRNPQTNVFVKGISLSLPC